MSSRGRAAAIAAAIAITGALAACASPDGSSTTASATLRSEHGSRAPEVKDLAGLKQADVMAILGQPDLKREEPPAELWQYRAADCVLNLFFYDEAGGARLAHVEAWQRTLAAAGSVPARCHDEDAPIKAHLISQSTS